MKIAKIMLISLMLQLQFYYNELSQTHIPIVSFGAREGSNRHGKLIIND